MPSQLSLAHQHHRHRKRTQLHWHRLCPTMHHSHSSESPLNHPDPPWMSRPRRSPRRFSTIQFGNARQQIRYPAPPGDLERHRKIRRLPSSRPQGQMSICAESRRGCSMLRPTKATPQRIHDLVATLLFDLHRQPRYPTPPAKHPEEVALEPRYGTQSGLNHSL
jgi:hypothetical protein